MEKFIFNRDYFNEKFMHSENHKASQETKLEVISKKINSSIDSCRSKLLYGRRPITETDYKCLRELDPLLVLNTNKLIGKLFLRVNQDFLPNQKYVLYIMLCLLADGKKSVGLCDIEERASGVKFRPNLIEEILKEGVMPEKILSECVKLKDNDKKLYKSENGNYSINLSNLILFTEYEESVE